MKLYTLMVGYLLSTNAHKWAQILDYGWGVDELIICGVYQNISFKLILKCTKKLNHSC